MNKPRIIAIVGPSGSGKTTMAEHLKRTLGIPVLVSYTTRPAREGEVDGVDHHFVGEDDMPDKKQMLAHTKFGGYHYWSHARQVPDSGACSYVIDEKGLLSLWENFDDRYEIIPILVRRDNALLQECVRKERLRRDRHRVRFEDGAYMAIIENNGSMEDFKETITKTVKNILAI